jgi:hypothetical protein
MAAFFLLRSSGWLTISVLDQVAKVRGSLKCCKSGSALILGGWIRIQEGKKLPHKKEKNDKFYV